MNSDCSPAKSRIIVSDVDGSRWLLLLDRARATGCILPLPGDRATGRHIAGSAYRGIEFSWRQTR